MKTIRKLSLLSLLLLPSLCFSAENKSPKRLSPINRDFPDQYQFGDGTTGRIKILQYSPDGKNLRFASEDHDPGAVIWGKTKNLIQKKNNRMRKKHELPTEFSWFTQDEQVFETVEEREEYLRKKKKKVTSLK